MGPLVVELTIKFSKVKHALQVYPSSQLSPMSPALSWQEMLTNLKLSKLPPTVMSYSPCLNKFVMQYTNLKLSKSPPTWRLLPFLPKTCHNLKADAVLHPKTTKSHNLQNKHKCANQLYKTCLKGLKTFSRAPWWVSTSLKLGSPAWQWSPKRRSQRKQKIWGHLWWKHHLYNQRRAVHVRPKKSNVYLPDGMLVLCPALSQ